MLSYGSILEEARRLEPRDQLRLLESLASQLRHAMPLRKKHSILELEGLGKELWADIDAQDYVHQERDAWNG